jgi:diadenosine tetraphosphatase ApaH/serine/threonine PP2A family protein phosphatase
MEHEKYAVLGDIHGNWEALDAVLKDAEEQGVTSYVCVGDIVGYNADPARCLQKMRDLKAVTVCGNHDHYCSHDECLEDFHPLAANVVDWTRRQLSKDDIAYLRELRLKRMAGNFTIVHSTLDMPDKWGYVFDILEADASFNYQSTSLCFHGHTHVPVVFEKQGRVTRVPYGCMRLAMGKKYFVNVGSVGQPRDRDPRSAYVIYDSAKKELELRRVTYEIEKAQAKIRKVNLPERLAWRLGVGQ